MYPFFTFLVASWLTTVPLATDDYTCTMEDETLEKSEENIKLLVASIQKAKQVVLYEGLPRQQSETNLLTKELKTKKTVKFNGFPFYDAVITPNDKDVKKLAMLCGERKTFRPHVAPKRCGEYHPDWLVEWRDGENSYRVLICFGCEEAKLYGPKNEVYSDLDTNAFKMLAEILTPYRKNRPKPEKLKSANRARGFNLAALPLS